MLNSYTKLIIVSTFDTFARLLMYKTSNCYTFTRNVATFDNSTP